MTADEVEQPTGELAIAPAAAQATRRPRLSRESVLRTAVALADEIGLEALTVRRLSDELGVVPMALYKHVANKEELLDGMVDVVLGEIDPSTGEGDWKSAVRNRILSARRSLRRHPWAPEVFVSRSSPTPATIAYIDTLLGMLMDGGFSADLTHHALHALGSRGFGFTQEFLKESPRPDGPPPSPAARELAMTYPHILKMMAAISHDRSSYVGGCDDQFEFEFALDILLDGLEERRVREATTAQAGRP
jgi:AcrR family transcriptional regulator